MSKDVITKAVVVNFLNEKKEKLRKLLHDPKHTNEFKWWSIYVSFLLNQ